MLEQLVKTTDSHSLKEINNKKIPSTAINRFKKKLLAAACLTFAFGLGATNCANADVKDYLPSTNYGTGEQSIYFKFELDSSQHLILREVTNEEYDFKVNYDNSNTIHSRTIPSENMITKDFIGSTFEGNSGEVRGGAIYNNKTINIESIENIFVNNSVTTTEAARSWGGAIYNHTKTISNITSNFINNSLKSAGHGAIGGAIANLGTINYLNGDFIGNSASARGNKSSCQGLGGAIYNSGQIVTIIGNFIGNYTSSEYNVRGGAIQNEGTITEIKNSSFINNYAYTTSNDIGIFAKGGAIYSNKSLTINTNNGKTIFRDNYVKVGSNPKQYEAIYMDSSSINLTFNTTNNGTLDLYDYINGVSGYTTIFTGDASGIVNLYNDVKNGAVSTNTVTMNLANNETHEYSMYNLNSNANTKWIIDVDIDNQKSDTLNNTSSGSTGTVTLSGLNFINGNVEDIIDDQITIQVLKLGTSNIKLANGFQGLNDQYVFQDKTETVVNNPQTNTLWSAELGAKEVSTQIIGQVELASTSTTDDSISITVNDVIKNETWLEQIDTLKGVNLADIGDRNFNASSATETYTVTDNLGTTASGTMAINGIAGTTPALDGEDNPILDENGNPVMVPIRSIVDFDENNNYSGFVLNNDNTTVELKNVEVKNSSGLVTGTNTNTEVILNNVVLDGTNGGITTAGDVTIKGNSNISDRITVTDAGSKIDVDGTNGEVTLDGMLIGAGSGSNPALNLTGDVNLTDNAMISGLDTTLTNATLNLAKESTFYNQNLGFAGNSTLNTENGSVGTLSLNNFNLNGVLTMNIDADLENARMDKLTATNATITDGSAINIAHINLLSPSTERNLSLNFTDNMDIANIVNYTGDGEIVYSPIYKYNTSYDPSSGNFNFAMSGSGGSESFNPAVITTPVAAQAGVQATMNTTMNYAFQQADAFTKLPAADRFLAINANRYAINDIPLKDAPFSSTDFNENLTPSHSDENSGIWVRPYVVFENIPLKNGPKVNATSYGTLLGFDTDFHHLRKGWHSVTSGYIGYNGAQISYSGVDTSLNGGLLGVTETFYKKNFWTAVTATVGASVAENNTMYGHDNSTSLSAGFGSKTGYNFEFKEGKFIIQPIWFMSYSMINTFDYKNAAGVRIDSKPLHTIQLNPTLRFIGNIKGWQPYASVGMVWNVMDKTDATANGVKLPEMHVKPYVQYGVGVQKQFGENFTGFLQAMITNGGRNGISLTGGFRWAIGKDSTPKEKVYNNNGELKVKNEKSKTSSTKTSAQKTSKQQSKLSETKQNKNNGRQKFTLWPEKQTKVSKKVEKAPKKKSLLKQKIDKFFALMNGEVIY